MREKPDPGGIVLAVEKTLSHLAYEAVETIRLQFIWAIRDVLIFGWLGQLYGLI